MVWQVTWVKAGRCEEGSGKAGEVRRGTARCGPVRQGRFGKTRHDEVWNGAIRQVWLGFAWWGLVW